MCKRCDFSLLFLCSFFFLFRVFFILRRAEKYKMQSARSHIRERSQSNNCKKKILWAMSLPVCIYRMYCVRVCICIAQPQPIDDLIIIRNVHISRVDFSFVICTGFHSHFSRALFSHTENRLLLWVPVPVPVSVLMPVLCYVVMFFFLHTAFVVHIALFVAIMFYTRLQPQVNR